MRTVHEVSRLTGVSVRTLHHYDALGLLKPTQTTEAGYRLYDQSAIGRLQSILLFRELQFPLKEIKSIIDSPDFDRKTAMEQQLKLLELRRERLDELIILAREIMKTGVNNMDFSAFDKTEFNKYAAEAKAKWGKTDAYKEYEQKTKNQTPEEINDSGNQLMNIFTELGEKRQLPPESPEAQSIIEKLRQFITDNFYNCTPEILRGLGQMYAAGGSMTENIDKAGGDGTAVFAERAIEFYCDKLDVEK